MCRAYSLLDPPPNTATEHAMSRYDSTEICTYKKETMINITDQSLNKGREE